MSDKKQYGQQHRNKPVRILLPFDQAVNGLLALSPGDAKAVRESVNKPAKTKRKKK